MSDRNVAIGKTGGELLHIVELPLCGGYASC